MISHATAGATEVELVCGERFSERIAEYLMTHYYKDFAVILHMSKVQLLRPYEIQCYGG